MRSPSILDTYVLSKKPMMVTKSSVLEKGKISLWLRLVKRLKKRGFMCECSSVSSNTIFLWHTFVQKKIFTIQMGIPKHLTLEPQEI